MIQAHTIRAARLHGPADLRIETVPPRPLEEDQVLLRVGSVGVCGSDLHVYRHAMIGDTRLEGPLVLGHEFGGTVLATQGACLDGCGQPLEPGARVAVDPATACWRCELCERGHPNLCRRLRFFGLYPDDGALCEQLGVSARNCFPIPETIGDDEAPLLESLGVALHTGDLAHVRPGQSAVIVGAGPIGLLILQVLRVLGCAPLVVVEPLAWRRQLALSLGATSVLDSEAPALDDAMEDALDGRGADLAIEAAHGGAAPATAARAAAHGARLLIVGIDPHDRLELPHGVCRRKGLSIIMVRRMKHVYPRAIAIVERGRIDLKSLISHRFSLDEADRALGLCADYEDGVVKAVIRAT